MILNTSIGGRDIKIDTENFHVISIPVDFKGNQPNTYGAAKAESHPYQAGSIIGDTRQGGSCNFEKVSIIPHCNGTHTECIGHITNERVRINSVLKQTLILADLITIQPINASASGEKYSCEYEKDDTIISRAALEKAVTYPDANALIVRTLPNGRSKKQKLYRENKDFPFYSVDAMEYISSLPVQHLLTDTPSVDRLFDDGKLAAHRIYWNIPEGSFEAGQGSRRDRTITEMIYADENIKDGLYLLNIQIPDFCSDAAPSRVVLFPLV